MSTATDWSDRLSLTFTIGVYVAVNAVRDAYCIVDGPDCAHLKTQFLQGNHDWLADLTSVTGVHRVANTDLHPWKMVLGRDEEVEGVLRQMASYAGAGAVLVTSLPMATITGLDYDRATRAVGKETGKLVASVPSASLAGDWLDGYAATLKSLARAVSLDGAAPQPGNVALVGYLFDRHEGDHRANLAEIRRLLEGCGITLGAVWLSGGTLADLAEVRRASAIVSLPYGRDAAAILADRLGVPIVEAGLPFGLDGTARWLRQIAEPLGCADRVDAVCGAEFARALPALEWVVPYHLLHRRLAFVGDPHLGLALDEAAGEVGLTVERHLVLNRRGHAEALLRRCGEERVVIDPKRNTLQQLLTALCDGGECDLLVTCSLGMTPGLGEAAIVELGFPSFFTHALEDRPFLGVRGFVAVVERMVNELRRAEVAAALRRGDLPPTSPRR
jgi:nitrogenase molybdenum-iron protein alpha/beta subunit